MTRGLIERWNRKVSPDDIVYVLGDFLWTGKDDQIKHVLKSLNGQIILIKGNHDRFIKNAGHKKLLADVKDKDDICVTLKNGTKKRVILDHHYMPFYNGARYNAIHLHGHSHISIECFEELRMTRDIKAKGFHAEIFNVGCMHWDFEPVTLDEILEKGPAKFDAMLNAYLDNPTSVLKGIA